MLVSEVMLQQTPVSRVAPVYQRFLARWPRPGDLAAEPVGEVIRAWGRLGYPRRAVRLHQAAGVIATQHGGEVPHDRSALRDLPGVGEYTAAAVAAFAYDQPVAVLDTNVRRVLARVVAGRASPPAHLTNTERAVAQQLVPSTGAGRWAVAVMELGALVCTSGSPACEACPVARDCAWLAAGRPESERARRRQPFVGTDRQVRGLLMAVVRESDSPVAPARLEAVWADAEQRQRALASLLADGLLVLGSDGDVRLPS